MCFGDNMVNKNKHDMSDEEFMNQYGNHFTNIKSNVMNDCPSAEKLDNFYHNQLPTDEHEKVQNHIDQCLVCTSILDDLKAAEMRTVNEAETSWENLEPTIDNKFYAFLNKQAPIEKTEVQTNLLDKIITTFAEKLTSTRRNLFQTPKLAYAGSFAILLIVGLYTFTYFNRSDTFNLTHIQFNINSSYRSSSSSQAPFDLGMTFLKNGNYRNAISNFNKAISENPEHMISHFYLGLSFLLDSKRHLPGLVYGYDRTKVEQAILHLNKALSLNNDNIYYQEDCYWLLGKAQLMVGKIEEAKANFQNIINLSDPNLMRVNEAKEMVTKIDILND
jgi:tetratricopeptide (TPR) repeat protein